MARVRRLRHLCAAFLSIGPGLPAATMIWSVSQQSSSDVVVLGAGLIGLAVALRAAQRGARVVVLERGQVGAGASHVAAGMLAPVAEADAGERDLLALGLASARLWPAFARELHGQTGVDPGYRELGTLVVARDRDGAEALTREAALRDALGAPVQRLLPSAARTLEPGLAPSVRGALLAPDDHAVDPRATLTALAAAVRGAGVEIRERDRGGRSGHLRCARDAASTSTGARALSQARWCSPQGPGPGSLRGHAARAGARSCSPRQRSAAAATRAGRDRRGGRRSDPRPRGAVRHRLPGPA